MKDNHRSSSSSSSAHNHNHMHQRTAEHDGTPGNECTLAALGTPSTRHLKRSYSDAGFDHDPSGSSSTIPSYINEPDRHQHHQTPTRMPVQSPLPPSSSSISAFSSASCLLSSSPVIPISLFSHPQVPLSSLHQSTATPSQIDSISFMSQPPQRGPDPETDPVEDPDSPSLSPDDATPSIPDRPLTPPPNDPNPPNSSLLNNIHSPRGVRQRLPQSSERPTSGPSRQHDGRSLEETAPGAAAGKKRSRSPSSLEWSEVAKRSRVLSHHRH